MADGPVVTVGVEPVVDPAAAAAAVADIENLGAKGGAAADAAFQAKVASLGPAFAKEVAAAFARMQSGVKDTTSQVGRLDSSLTEVGRAIAVLATQLKDLGHSDGTVRSGVVGQTEAIRRASIEATTAVQSAAKQQTAIVQSEAAQANIAAQTAGQKQVIAARTFGQERVAIVRGVVDTIGRLEKGLGVAISGVARTTVSAFSKTFSGLGSALGSVFNRADSEAFSASNPALRAGLNTRESIIKSSMRTQESLVRESVTRQERQLTELRETSQKGLLGAANNRGLFASLGATIGLGAVARSTFTIGADFTRGLAVLQAQLGLTADQMKGVRQLSLDLGNDLSLPGVSALDAAQAIQGLSKQFAALGPGAVTAASQAAKGTLQLSRAAGVGADAAAGIVGNAVNVFGVAADQAVAVADQITGALKEGAGVSFDDFAASFKQGASVFSQFVTPAEGATDSLTAFNTALAILARQGLVGSDAGTSLKNFFLQANRGTDDANSALAEISEKAGVTGTAFFDAEGKSRKFSDTLDILRKGLAGLTDEQRNATLQTIFGTDAQRVANALLSVSSEEYERVSQAVREQGLAAKIAAAQNAGFAGALDALKSVVETVQITVYQFLEPALKTATLAIADFFSALAFGDGDTLAAIRQGLLGVAAGLAAILAVKGAVEVFALLGKTIALAATPFGALVLAAGVIGGVLGVMSAQGLSLGEVFGNIKDKLVEFAGAAKDFLVPIFDRVKTDVGQFLVFLKDAFAALPLLFTGGGEGDDKAGLFFTEKLTPLQKAVVTFRRFLVDAHDFIVGSVFPVFERLASFVVDTVVPALLRAAGAVKDFALIGLGALQELGQRIQPIVQPILSGFADLGRGIGNFVTGASFSRVTDGFASAGKGIAQVATQIGQNILTALTPIATKVADFFTSLFTLSNLGSAVDAIGTFLNFIGEKVGAFVSSPSFLSAVGIVAAALIVVGAKWALALATGLLEGLASNIPQLLNNAGDLLINTLFGSFTSGAATIAVTALVLTVGRALVTGFRTVGESGARGLLEGFKSKVGSGGSFLGSFFSGADSTIGRSGQGLLGGLKTQAQDLQNQLRALGSTTIVNPSSIKDATRELGQLKQGLSATQIAGLEMRDRFASAGRAISSTFSGLKNIVGGVKDIGVAVGSQFNTGVIEQVKAGGSRVAQGFRDIFQGLKTAAREQGTTIGAVLGKSIVAGVAALGAGVASGQQIGQGNTLMGLLGLGTSAIGIGAAFGGPIGVAAGVATLGIGAFTAAVTSGSEAAKQYKQQVDDIANALDPKLTAAAKAGQITIEQLRDGLDFSDLGGTDAFADVLKQFQDLLGTGTKENFAGLSSLIADSLRAGDSIETLRSKFTAAAVSAGSFGKDAAAVLRVITAINKPGGAKNFADVISESVSTNGTPFGLSDSDVDTARKYAGSIDEITSASNDLTGAYNKTSDALHQIGVDQAFAAAAFTDSGVSIGQIIPGFEALGAAAAGISLGITDLIPGLTALRDAKIELPHVENDGVVEGVSSALQSVIDKKNEINQLFENGVLPPGTSGLADATNVALLQLDGIGAKYEETLTNAASDAVRNAQQNEILKTLGDNAARVIGAGFKEGIVVDEASARSAIQPLLDEALRGVENPVLRQAIIDTFDNVVVELTPAVEDAKAADVAIAALGVMQGVANSNPIYVGFATQDTALSAFAGAASGAAGLVTIPSVIGAPTLEPGWEGEAAALVAAATPTLPTLVFPPAAIGLNFIPGGALLAAGAAAGANLGQGLINGINSKSAAVGTAASNLANTAIQHVHRDFRISSPSKVFHQIGVFVGQGLAEGIDASAENVEQSISDLVAGAIDQATGQLSSAAKAFRNGSLDLFDAFFGEGNVGGRATIGGLQGGITSAFNSLASTLDSSISQAADVLKRSATEALSRSDLDILGESGTSLNTADVLGNANRGALGGALSSIAELAKEMVAQGAPVEQVVSTVSAYTDRLRELAGQYGLSSSDVEDLIDQYGLSSDSVNEFVSALATLSAGLGQTVTDADKLNQTIIDLFDHATTDAGKKLGTALGAGAAEQARAAVTTSKQGIASALDGALGQLDAIAKATEPLTNAQRDVAGENAFSLDFGDVLGAQNRAAFATAFGDIQKLGEALLAGGSSAEYVTGEIHNQVAALADYAASLGFNRDEVLALAASLGLSDQALQDFLASVEAARTTATDGAANAANPNVPGGNVPGLPPGSNNPTLPTDVPISVRVDVGGINVPYGDPAAIGLAVGNRVATSIRLLS